MKRYGRFALVSILALAACSGSTSSNSSPTTTSNAAALVPKETPIGTLTLTGDGELTGPASGMSIRCDFPELEGQAIAVLGTAYDAATSFRMGVHAGKVTVRLYSTGSDGRYVERAFEGTGVTGFDASKGAAIDSPLTEESATNGAPAGSLGALTSIKGSFDCREQKPGSSTLTLTGETADGALDAATLDHVRVECNQDALGQEAVVQGLVTVGASKALLSIGLRADGINVFETLESSVQRRYQAPPGAATPTATGGHASGDAVEQDATPPHTIHVEGDVTCGSSV